MQAELRYCIYEENYSKIDKIIILFKGCLKALKDFNKKRIQSLDEIRRILIHFCSLESKEYSSQVKQMVFIGSKIIYEATDKDSDNMKEILTMNGVEIISKIIDLILHNSFTVQRIQTDKLKKDMHMETIHEQD